MDARLNVNTSPSVLGPASTPAGEAQGEGFGAALTSASQQQSGDSAAPSQAPVVTESSPTESGVKSPSQPGEPKAQPPVDASVAKADDTAPEASDDSDNGNLAKVAEEQASTQSGKESFIAANPLQPGRQQPASTGAKEIHARVDDDEPAVAKDTHVSGDDRKDDLPASGQSQPSQRAAADSKSADGAAENTAASDGARAVDVLVTPAAKAAAQPSVPEAQPTATGGQGAKETAAVAAVAIESSARATGAEADTASTSATKVDVVLSQPGPGAQVVGSGGDSKGTPSPFAGLAQAEPAGQPASPQEAEAGDGPQLQAAMSTAKTGEPHSTATAAQPLTGRPAQATKAAAAVSAQAASGVDSAAAPQAKGQSAGHGEGDAPAPAPVSGDKANGELLAQLQGLKQAQDKLSSAPKGRMTALTPAAEGGTTSTATPPQPTATDAEADPLSKWVNEMVKTDGSVSGGRTAATLTSEAAVPTPESMLANSAAAVEAAEAAELELDPQLRLHQARTPEARVQAHQQLQQDPAAALRQPVAAERMAPELRERMMMMINSRTSQAEIRLDPPELGALQVKIQMNGDQAQVQMHAAQAQTRELVEQALPRLREMLAQQGITLADTHISHGGGGQTGNEAGNGQGQGGQQGFGEGMVEASDDTLATVQQMTGRNADGGIDYYA
ncbi:flagellar hook-length control protein FliK [Ferrimonas sediminum]|uniref:Flagellar hook-length control protein FliK n=1 Tax=Ferrimonas sediminum TaxID=718193 RepID=A0A1G8YWJ3_9GAMM|nr:flagellar hook-length control protein FliK [Ferrimonas sediminum]SDK06784.1 flagellar hook-length control protein FliK [Ferrimonas sediminum]